MFLSIGAFIYIRFFFRYLIENCKNVETLEGSGINLWGGHAVRLRSLAMFSFSYPSLPSCPECGFYSPVLDRTEREKLWKKNLSNKKRSKSIYHVKRSIRMINLTFCLLELSRDARSIESSDYSIFFIGLLNYLLIGTICLFFLELFTRQVAAKGLASSHDLTETRQGK